MNADPLVLAPLRLEMLALRRGARALSIERIGMGPVRATAARVRIARSVSPGRPIVLAGVAGGLVSGLEAGDVIVATSIGSTESDESVALLGAAELAEHLEGAGIPTRLAPMVSSPRILHGAEQRGKAAASGALAVEMEALWLTPLRSRYPFFVVRVVLDTIGAELGSLATPGAVSRAYRSLRDCARAFENFKPERSDDHSTRSR